MLKTLKQPVLGVIVGNRGFFPAHLCDSGRKTILTSAGERRNQCDRVES